MEMDAHETPSCERSALDALGAAIEQGRLLADRPVIRARLMEALERVRAHEHEATEPVLIVALAEAAGDYEQEIEAEWRQYWEAPGRLRGHHQSET